MRDTLKHAAARVIFVTAGVVGAGALLGACQDFNWSPNESPVCNETVQSTVQPVIKALDILFVIDNSGTMREEQESLAANFQTFVEKLVDSDADYQIGIITTDVESDGGSLQTKDDNPDHKIIKSSWDPSEIISVFQQNIVQGTDGTSFEKGLEAMSKALSAEMRSTALSNGGNQGFLRDDKDSTLGIVFISDENDCSHPPCQPGDQTCIQESDPLFECDDKAATLIPVEDYFDEIVDTDGSGPEDTGLRAPRKVIVASIIGLPDETAQDVSIRTKEGTVRELEVACWPIDPENKVPPTSLGSAGQIATTGDPEAKGANFLVPNAEHSFSEDDVGLWVRIVGATEAGNNGVWRVQSVDPGANSAYLSRGDDLFVNESGLSWELGASPGMATDSTRYAEFVSRFDRGFVSTICTFDWQATLDRLGASFTLQFDFCLNNPPAGLTDLLNEYANPRDACPDLGQLVGVRVDGADVACNDGAHPWYIVQDQVTCSSGSGYKVTFPDSLRQHCTTDPVGPQCFPSPGQKAEIFYLSEEGNSDRCTSGG